MNNKNAMKYIVVFATVLIIILAAVLILRYQEKAAAPEAGMALTIDPNSGIKAETSDNSEEKEHTGGIAIPGWGSIEITANETEVAVNLKNPESNMDKYNMTFEITLEGEDEPIAETGLIPPGESALKLRLHRALEAGEYNATIHVQPYRIDTNTPTNNADIETKIIVK